MHRYLTTPLAGFLVAVFAVGVIVADEPDSSQQRYLPQKITAEAFGALRESSPFVRSVNFSDSIVLTGLARIDGELTATLYDAGTKESFAISNSVDARGWQLVDVKGDEDDLTSVTARISIAGGQMVFARYDETIIEQRPKPKPAGYRNIPQDQREYIADRARNYRDGFRGDGIRGAPPPELVRKLSQLSEQQRGQIIYRMSEMRREGISSEDRQKAYVNMVDQALKGKR